jgi:orotidine-5'-phosphate decarboxylase
MVQGTRSGVDDLAGGIARDAVTDDDVRAHLALALDVPDADSALELARQVHPWFGVAKVGLELWAAAGPPVVERLRDLDLEVFCDLKLHDIPTTVGRACRVLGRLGARYVNMHAAGGVDMLRAGVEGLVEGARDAGATPCHALGVTVLTSDPDTSAFDARLDATIAAGCDGVVCSAHEVERVRGRAPRFVTVVPGIRLLDGDEHDQARVATPTIAIRNGASVLVLGRSVTGARDVEAAAAAVAAEARAALI